MSAKKAAQKNTVKNAPVKQAVKKAAKKIATIASSKSLPKQTNIEKLVAAGVIRDGKAEKHNHAVINKLSTTEVNTLVKLRSKLGALHPADEDLAPNFPV